MAIYRETRNNATYGSALFNLQTSQKKMSGGFGKSPSRGFSGISTHVICCQKLHLGSSHCIDKQVNMKKGHTAAS